MKSQVCIDASFGLKLVLAEAHSERAERMWQDWVSNQTQVCVPSLYLYEAVSALRGRVYRRHLLPEEGDLALASLLAQAVVQPRVPDLYPRAWSLAKRLKQPKTYDCCYLALAEALDCEFWTADERLYNSVADQLPRVKWIGGQYERSE